jgi:hypothetical protein
MTWTEVAATSVVCLAILGCVAVMAWWDTR